MAFGAPAADQFPDYPLAWYLFGPAAALRSRRDLPGFLLLAMLLTGTRVTWARLLAGYCDASSVICGSLLAAAARPVCHRGAGRMHRRDNPLTGPGPGPPPIGVRLRRGEAIPPPPVQHSVDRAPRLSDSDVGVGVGYRFAVCPRQDLGKQPSQIGCLP